MPDQLCCFSKMMLILESVSFIFRHQAATNKVSESESESSLISANQTLDNVASFLLHFLFFCPVQRKKC